VLRLLSDGLSIPAIAMTMFISQSTAKTYVARLYEKLGVTNRAQALMTAVQFDLIGHQCGISAQVVRAPGTGNAIPKRGATRAISPQMRRGQKVGLAATRARARDGERPAPGIGR
jgi:hypothetical protein